MVDLSPALCNRAPCHALGAALAGSAWRRALAVSAAKRRITRAISVPLTRSGRQRNLGHPTERTSGPNLGLGCPAAIASSLRHCGAPRPTKLEQAQLPPQIPALPSQPSPLASNELSQLHMLLNAFGLNAGPSDGISSPQTEAVAGQHKAARGPPQVGRADGQLLDRLRKERATPLASDRRDYRALQTQLLSGL